MLVALSGDSALDASMEVVATGDIQRVITKQRAHPRGSRTTDDMDVTDMGIFHIWSPYLFYDNITALVEIVLHCLVSCHVKDYYTLILYIVMWFKQPAPVVNGSFDNRMRYRLVT